MSDGDPEDRAKKLQGRFTTSGTSEADETSSAPPTSDSANADEAEKAEDTPDTSNSSEASNTSNTQKAGKASDADETTPLRDRPTKLLYLEEDQKRNLELAFDELNLRYKRERDEELQQNDDWWPVLLQVGYEAIGDVSDVDLEKFDQARKGQFAVRDEDTDGE